MKHLNLLIKPASSGCNLRCKYCFYYDIADNRKVKNYGIMNEKTLENIVRKAFEEVEYSVNFTFQGGEPLVAGMKYFEVFHKLVDKYNKKKIFVNFALQTNGTLVDKRWIEFFKKFNYLIGISIDGNKEIHDNFRIDSQGKGTFTRVIKTAKLLKKANINFNILCVVNSVTAKNGEMIYKFFRNMGFKYYQFIPCLDSLEGCQNEDFTLRAKDYGIFLDETFKLWYDDIMSGKIISMRRFDNYIRILLNEAPEACDMVGHCNMNAVLEADGSMYPCDFYVLDEYKVGNINEKNFTELFNSDAEQRFLISSLDVPKECKECKYYSICRGGCRRYKELDENGVLKNKFCESYKYFFDRNLDKMIEVAKYVLRKRMERC